MLETQIIKYVPHLRRYARVLLKGDVRAADDLVQDSLERALHRSHLWRRGSNLRTWLFTIMHNLYVNQVRRQINAPQWVALSDSDNIADQATADSEVLLRDMQRALNTLPADQREIISLVTLEGLRYHEVARIMDIPEGTVMSRLSRARKRLRNYLAGESVQHIRRVK